jgi:multicomponent Na+:H+ antiporter subunit C
MELPLALTIGLLFAGGVYSILRPNVIRMVVGFGLFSNGVNLLMIVCGGYSLRNAAPFVEDAEAVAGLMDPLPPDIVLTAIVISFAVGALFLILGYVVYRDYGTDDLEALPLPADDETAVAPEAPRRLGYEE